MRKVLEKIAKVTIDDEDGRLVSINIDGKELEVGGIQGGYQLTVDNNATIGNIKFTAIFANNDEASYQIDSGEELTLENVIAIKGATRSVDGIKLLGGVYAADKTDSTVSYLDDEEDFPPAIYKNVIYLVDDTKLEGYSI